MRRRTREPQSNATESDRGQAYTLEGFIGALVVLMAVLFAVQSVVITPTTGGEVDRSVQGQLQGEAKDALVVAANDGDLSHLVRYWNSDERRYHNGSLSDARRGSYSHDGFANTDRMSETDDGQVTFEFGQLLDERFKESGRSYNVQLSYHGEDGPESFYLVYQSRPSSNAFAASQTITLYDEQRLTPQGQAQTLEDAAAMGYPIPDVDDGELYNVVEVRVVVW